MRWKLSVISFCVLQCFDIVRCQQTNVDAQTVLQESLDRSATPTMANGEPTVVYAGFYLESMSALDVKEMSTDIDIYFRLSWKDPSLGRVTGLLTRTDVMKVFWKPDLIFSNGKNERYHDIINPNFGMWIESDGTVAYSARITMTVACPMDLSFYPLDYQECEIRIASYGHTFDEMPLRWFEQDPIEINRDIELPEYEVLFDQTKATHCDGGSDTGKVYTFGKTHKGTKEARFGCLAAKMYFKRQFGFHLVQTYIPTAVIVMISWVGFWIEPTAVPARISLSFTTLLTLTTMGAGLRFSLPAVSYAKAVDVWFMACMGFVFAALIEFAICNSYVRRAAKCDQSADKILLSKTAGRSHIPRTDTGESAAGFSAAVLNSESSQYKKKAHRTDLICRFLFPICFLFFNVLYWIYYKADWPGWWSSLKDTYDLLAWGVTNSTVF